MKTTNLFWKHSFVGLIQGLFSALLVTAMFIQLHNAVDASFPERNLPNENVGVVKSKHLSKSAAATGEAQQQMAKLLGSMPPKCGTKCMGCKPCTAVLVVPPHPRMAVVAKFCSAPQQEENYYPLAWKCKCRNKTFQP